MEEVKVNRHYEVTRKEIVVQTAFEALHFWAEAPKSVEFLRHPHRHRFGVAVALELPEGATSDRYIEFFTVKRQLNDILARGYSGRTTPWSCEVLAERIGIDLLGVINDGGKVVIERLTCAVSEDGENVATVVIQIRG